jgi:hypothetical protein
MAIRRGDVPVSYFQRRLLGMVLQMLVGWFILVGGGLWLLGKSGMILGGFAAVLWAFGVVIRQWVRPPLCPNCSAPAEYAPDAHEQWRFRFPYGWAPRCPSCDIDLTKPYEGAGRGKSPVAAQPS